MPVTINKNRKSIHSHGPFLWGMLFAFGLWSFGAGLYWATSSYTVTNQNGVITAIYPIPSIGSLVSVLGIIVATFAYLGIRGRINQRNKPTT